NEGEMNQVGGRLPVGCYYPQLVTLLQCDRGVRYFECLDNTLYHIGQDCSGCGDLPQAPAKARQHVVWVVALAIEQPVCSPLQTFAQGLEEYGYYARGNK